MSRNRSIALAAIAFGVLTIFAGSSVLLGPGRLREAAGDVVLPVLWFNTLSGVAYVVAGAGLLLQKSWAPGLARAIAAAILIMLLGLVLLIATGTPWEPRTLGAMAVRLAFWIAVAWMSSTGSAEKA